MLQIWNRLPGSKLKPPSCFQTETTILFSNWILLPVFKLNHFPVSKLKTPYCFQTETTSLLLNWIHFPFLQTESTYLSPNWIRFPVSKRNHLPISELNPSFILQTESTYLFPNWIHLPVSKLKPASCFQTKVYFSWKPISINPTKTSIFKPNLTPLAFTNTETPLLFSSFIF